MAGATAGLIAGIVALAGAGGALVYAARRKAKHNIYRPAAMPPNESLDMAAGKAVVFPTKFAAMKMLMDRINEKRKLAFSQLTLRQKQMVNASRHLGDRLTDLVTVCETPYAGYSGADEVLRRAIHYEMVRTRLLDRWALLLRPDAVVVLLELTHTRMPINQIGRVELMHDIQIPPPHLPKGYRGWHKHQKTQLTAASIKPESPTGPAGMFSTMVSHWIRLSYETLSEQPWKPEFEAAQPVPQWLVDLEKEWIALFIGDEGAEGAENLGEQVAEDTKLAAERVFGAGMSQAQAHQVIGETRELLAQMIGLCRFWQSYQWW